MTHRDRAGDPSGHRAGSRQAAGDPGSAGGFAEASAGHPPSAAAAPLPRRTGRQGVPTPPPIRPLPVRPPDRNGGLPRLWDGAMLLDGAQGLRCPAIAAPRAPGRKPWETVSMGHYQRSLV